MKFGKFLSLAILLGLIFSANVVYSASNLNLPEPAGFVSDFAHLYSDSFKLALIDNLTNFANESKNEITVVTIDSLNGVPIEDYAISLAEKWKVGKKGQDNGVIMLISKADKKIRIEVGYGLEGVITDGRSGRIIREDISPYFKQGDYEAGTAAGIRKLEDYIKSGQAEDPVEKVHSKTVGVWPITKTILELLFNLPFLIFPLFLIPVYLVSFLGRSKSIWAGGVLGGVIGVIIGLLLGTLIFFLVSTVISGALGLLLDYLLSKNYQYRKSKGWGNNFWMSGGGFGSGKSGFGGFGGGSFGGGGASGDW